MKQLFPMTLGLWVMCGLFLFGCRKEKLETPPEKPSVESVEDTQEKKKIRGGNGNKGRPLQ